MNQPLSKKDELILSKRIIDLTEKLKEDRKQFSFFSSPIRYFRLLALALIDDIKFTVSWFLARKSLLSTILLLTLLSIIIYLIPGSHQKVTLLLFYSKLVLIFFILE